MSNTTIGPGAGTGTKKETVYSGPSPQPKPGTVSRGPSAPAGGTVYGGLAPGTNGGMISKAPAAAGTVYNGPGTGETVYNQARQNAAARPVQDAANTGGAKGGAIFFVIAAFSALNTLLILVHAPFVMAVGLAVTRVGANGDLAPVLALNVIALGVFVALGVFAMKGSKAAFLVGLLLYAGDTALLLLSDNPALHIPSILFHGFFLYGIVKAFRQLGS